MTTPIRRALLSVSNKEGLLDFARELRARGIAILSTGGTAALLRSNGIDVTDVSTVTGFPEIMDGRVKTLHPKIHGGLLGRRGTDDAVMRDHGIEAIDLVAVNLYPFAATIAKPGCTFEDAVENIDIGGPAMVRASAKNHDRVAIVVDPLDYGTVLAEMDRNEGGVSGETRLRLATKAFSHTAQYDAMVAAYLDKRGAALGRRVPGTAVDAVPQAAGPALRREPAPAGGVLRRERRARRQHRRRVAAAGQGALVQQHRRRRHGLRMRAAVRASRPASS